MLFAEEESAGAIIRDIALVAFSFFGTVFAGLMSYLMMRLRGAQASADKQRVVLTEKVEVIHKATNSLVTKLVEKTAEESFARGAKSETDKQSPGGV